MPIFNSRNAYKSFSSIGGHSTVWAEGAGGRARPSQGAVAASSFTPTLPCPSFQHLPGAGGWRRCLFSDVFKLWQLHTGQFSGTFLFAKVLDGSSAKRCRLPSVVTSAGWNCLKCKRCLACKSNGAKLAVIASSSLTRNFVRRQMEVAWEVLLHFGQYVHAYRKPVPSHT